jgi:hypothetical protein
MSISFNTGARFRRMNRISASSAESVGAFWLGEAAEVV